MKTQTQKLKNIDKEVEKRIDDFNQLTNVYIDEGAKILKDIMRLRKTQKRNYTILDLENEKGLEQHRDKIRPLLRYEGLNEKTYEYQKKGKISAGDVFLIANLPKDVKDKIGEENIVEGVSKGDITRDELMGNPKANIGLLYKFSQDPLDEYQKVLLKTIYQMVALARDIRENKEILRKNGNFKKFKEAFRNLEAEVWEVLK